MTSPTSRSSSTSRRFPASSPTSRLTTDNRSRARLCRCDLTQRQNALHLCAPRPKGVSSTVKDMLAAGFDAIPHRPYDAEDFWTPMLHVVIRLPSVLSKKCMIIAGVCALYPLPPILVHVACHDCLGARLAACPISTRMVPVDAADCWSYCDLNGRFGYGAGGRQDASTRGGHSVCTRFSS